MPNLGCLQQPEIELSIVSAELLPAGNALQIVFDQPVFSGGSPTTLENAGLYQWASWYIRVSNYVGEYVYLKLRPSILEANYATLFPAITIDNNYTCTFTLKNHIQSTASGILSIDLLCTGANNPFVGTKYSTVAGATNDPMPLLNQVFPITNNSTFTAWTPMLMRGIADWGAPKVYPFAFVGNFPYYHGFLGLTIFTFASQVGHTVSPVKVTDGVYFNTGGCQQQTPNPQSFDLNNAPVVLPNSEQPLYLSLVQTLTGANPAKSVSWTRYDAGGGGSRCGFDANASGVSFRAFGNFTARETTGLDFLVWSSDGVNVRCVNGVNTQSIAIGASGEFAIPGTLGWYPFANPDTTVHGWIMAFRDQTPADDLLWQTYVADVITFGDSVV